MSTGQTPAILDSGAQFRLFEQVVTVVGQASALRPMLLIVDDLQWADAASLELFGHLTGRLPAGAVIIGALRDRAPTPGSSLSRALAEASRLPGHRRIRLGPLGLADVTEARPRAEADVKSTPQRGDLADWLASIDDRDDRTFTEYGLDDQQIRDLRAWAHGWEGGIRLRLIPALDCRPDRRRTGRVQPVVAFDLDGSVGQDSRRAQHVDLDRS